MNGVQLKRGATTHPKIKALARKLGIKRFAAVGLMENLWHFTAERAPAGDVGRFTNTEIAEAVMWISEDDDRPESEIAADAARLISSLVIVKLLDETDAVRLVVHDWAQHCDDSVHNVLARSTKTFSDGSLPKFSRLTKREKSRCIKAFEKIGKQTHDERTPSESSTLEVRTAKPSLTQPSQALPSPANPSPASPPDRAPVSGIREALAWAGVGGGQKKCAEIPGLTPIGILILAEEIKKTNGGAGLIVQKITNGYTPPKLIAAETLSRLSRQGRIASICGHEVRASDGGSNVAYSTNGVLVISDQGVETRLKSGELAAVEIVVKLDKELASGGGQ